MKVETPRNPLLTDKAPKKVRDRRWGAAKKHSVSLDGTALLHNSFPNKKFKQRVIDNAVFNVAVKPIELDARRDLNEDSKERLREKMSKLEQVKRERQVESQER